MLLMAGLADVVTASSKPRPPFSDTTSQEVFYLKFKNSIIRALDVK